MARRLRPRAACALLCAAAAACGPIAPRAYEQTYLAANSNWAFRNQFREADRLFNGFDYGHAILYETLLRDDRDPTKASRRLEGEEFEHLTQHVLRHPPAVTLDEHAIAPRYATLVPELVEMFEWAHMLHRQLYDVLADDRIWPEDREARAREVLRYYQSRRDLALSAAPKGMELMEGAPYSLAFRRQDPKFNGLLWAYHWYQMAVYDALLAAPNPAGRHANVDAATRHFWELVDGAPNTTPATMPMSAAVAPRFSDSFVEAAIIFDNLHALHDVVSDILGSPMVAPRDKRATVLRAAAAYRDSTTAVISRAEWREMSLEMGVDRMGGPAPAARGGRREEGGDPRR